MRAGTSGGGDIVLLDETSDVEEQQLLAGMRDLDVEDKEEDVVERMKALAVERGDGNAPSRAFGLSEVEVKENPGVGRKAPLPPTAVTNGGTASNAVEGYHPRHGIENEMTDDSSADDNERNEDIIETI